MHLSLLALSLISGVLASPLNAKQAGKPPAFFLAGDSTTAAPSSGGGGWGNGFLSTLVNGANGTNFGHNGATTVSFVKGGDWANVLSAVTSHKEEYDPYVTIQDAALLQDVGGYEKALNRIQFGHNDQKAAANISVAAFSTNLANMVSDVHLAGGTPILVTSLSRRNYNSSGLVIEDLAPQVAATNSVAAETKTTVLHLNEESTKYLDAIGEEDAWQYNRIPDDYTHLNSAGEKLFGEMIGWLLEKSDLGKKVDGFVKLNETIVKAIEEGVFILPGNATQA